MKGAVVLVVLLGLTWIFGFLYVNRDTLVMAYMFTIINSLQGLFIFLFHCVGNEKVTAADQPPLYPVVLSSSNSILTALFQVQKEYKKIVRRTQWLPDCIRVHYGEHKGLSNISSNSSASGNVSYTTKPQY